MTRRARQPDIIFALIIFAGKTNGQAIRIKESGLLRQIAVAIDIGISAKQLFSFRLFEHQKKIVGQQAGALGGVVEPQTIGFAPALVEIDGRGVTLAESTIFNSNGPPVRILVPHLIEFAEKKDTENGSKETQHHSRQQAAPVGEKGLDEKVTTDDRA